MEIRPYRESDRADCYDICIRTGAAGQDGTGTYSDDELTPAIFCGPYLSYQPDLAWVVDDGTRAVGYVIGVSDTAAFVDWYRAEVLPAFAARFPLTEGLSDDEREMTELGHQPERMLIPELVDYPAHLHIDLLPEAQGQGLGRALISTLVTALAERGVPGVHLEMDGANVGAGAFYQRLGFIELPGSVPSSPLLGLPIAR
jgi:ribosomal protein S18 acetylase RimI-like enzyme